MRIYVFGKLQVCVGVPDESAVLLLSKNCRSCRNVMALAWLEALKNRTSIRGKDILYRTCIRGKGRSNFRTQKLHRTVLWQEAQER